MKYRIWTDKEKYKLQRKRLIGWIWLDSCKKWCNWYGKENPYIFYSKEEVLNFINKEPFKIIEEKEDKEFLIDATLMCDRCKKFYKAKNFLGKDFIFKAYWHNKEGNENYSYRYFCPKCIKSFERWNKNNEKKEGKKT